MPEERMQKPIILVNATKVESDDLCGKLGRLDFRPIHLNSLTNLEECIQGNDSRAVILDLDSIPVDNRTLREIKKRNPGLCILALSRRQHHPDLEESMSRYIYSCLRMPIDPEELHFWLRSIYERPGESNNQPET